MKTLKKFFIYFICTVALWIFSDVVIYLTLNGMYQKIEAKVFTEQPQVVITTCAATSANGVVRGTIKNNTEEIIQKEYVKIDFYSKRNVKMGTKYIAIENLKPNYNKDFEMWFRYSNVEYATISITNQAENAMEEEFSSQRSLNDLLVGGLIIVCLL